MPFTSWSNAIKLRACRYLLHRYLGQFLQEKLTLEQLSIDIASKSSARISDLNLDVVALNRALEGVKLPFEVLDGFIGSVSLVLPLSTIFSDSTELEISQLEVTLRPKSSSTKASGRVDDEFTLDTMLESMTMSTMDLAEQCIKNVDNVTETFDEVDMNAGAAEQQQQFGAEMFAGVEKFAQAVDIVLGRTKVCFLDTVFRIEHVYDDVRKHGIATEIRIKRIDYRDESLNDENQNQNMKSGLVPGDTARKRFTLDNIEIFSDQFSDKTMTLSSIPPKSSELHAHNTDSLMKSTIEPEIFKSAIDMSASTESTASDSTTRQYAASHSDTGLPTAMTTSFSRLASGLSSRLTKMISIASKCHVHVTLQNALPTSSGSSSSTANAAQKSKGMRVQLAVDVPSAYAVFWPIQLHALQMLFDAFLGSGASASLARHVSDAVVATAAEQAAAAGQRPLTDGDYGRIEAELRRQFNQRHQEVTAPRHEAAGNRLGRNNWAGKDDDGTHAADAVAGDDAELLQQYFDVASQQGSAKTSFSKNVVKPTADSQAAASIGARTDVRLKLNSLVVLVHEYDEWIDGKILGLVDFKKQDGKTNNFFDAVADSPTQSAAVLIADDKRRSKIAEICDSNHLLMLCAPLVVELTSDKRPAPPHAQLSSTNRRATSAIQQQSQHFDLVLYLSANQVHVWEHIYSNQTRSNSAEVNDGLLRLNTFPICSSLLSFPRSSKPSGEDELLYGNTAEPNVVVQVRAQTTNFDEKSSQPNIFVNVQLASFASDVDLSIIDRLHILLNPKSTLQHNNSVRIYEDTKTYDRHTRRNSSGSGRLRFNSANKAKNNRIALQISSPLATIRLKIPVYDGRASPLEKILDENRLKSVHLHAQTLVLELERLTFNIMLSSPQTLPTTSFAVACQGGKLLFQPDAASDPVPIAFIKQSNSPNENELRGDNNNTRQPCEIKFTIKSSSNGDGSYVSEAGGFQNVAYGGTIQRIDSNADDVSSTTSSNNNTDDEFYSPPVVASTGKSAEPNQREGRNQPNLFASSRRIVDGEDKGLLYISPSDVDTVEKFQADACAHANLLIEVVLPQVYLVLADKPFFELFYNRVFNDLFMWEPLSLIMAKFGLTLEGAVLGRTAATQDANTVSGMYGSTVTLGNNDDAQFREFKRRNSADWNMPIDGLNEDDENDDDDLLSLTTKRSSVLKNSPNKTNNNNMFYSVHAGGAVDAATDVGSAQREPKLLSIDAARSRNANDVAVMVRILQGAVVMRTPVYGGEPNSVENNVAGVPRVHGEVYTQLSCAKIFVVGGYHGQPELQYVFISAQDGGMYSTPRISESLSQYFHTLSTETKFSWSILPPTLIPAPYLKPILMPSAAVGITKSFEFTSNSKTHFQTLPEMLRVAIELNFDPFRNVKDIRLALGVAHTALYHRFVQHVSTSIDWLQQLIDFFDVEQYPIEGLSWPTTVTELHVDAVDCCVLYRPLHMPLTCAVFVGRLNISSTIMAEAVSTLLRVVVQDLWVMLSDNDKTRRRRQKSGSTRQTVNTIDLAQDFVCVVEVPHFELETRVSNNKKQERKTSGTDSEVVEHHENRLKYAYDDMGKPKVPAIDLKISNSAVHVRSCSDSFQALCDLLVYCANLGDFGTEQTAGAATADGAMQNSTNSASNMPSLPVLNADSSSRTLNPVESALPPPPSYASAMLTSTTVAPPPVEAAAIDLQMCDAMQDDYRQQQVSSSATGTTNTSASSRAHTTTEEDESDDFAAFEAGKQTRRTSSKKRSNIMTQSVHQNLASAHQQDLAAAENLRNNPMVKSMHVRSAVVPLRKTRSSQHKPHRHHRNNHGDDPMIRSAVTLGDEDFCLIDEDLGAGILPKTGQIAIKRLLDIKTEASSSARVHIKIVDNHFAVPTATAVDQLKAPPDFPCPEERVIIHDMNVMFCIYGGADFGSNSEVTEKAITKNSMLEATSSKSYAVETADSRTSAATSSSQILHRSRIPTWLRQGGPERDHSKLLEIHANKIRFQHDRYAYDGKSKPAARQVLLVKTIEILDRLQSSSINKFLYQYSTSSLPRQTHTNMLEIRALHERRHPDVSPQQECSLKVSLQPLRLNVDQETLLFLRDWGSALGAAAAAKTSSSTNAPQQQPPPASSPSLNVAASSRQHRQRTPSSASLSSTVSAAASNGTIGGGTNSAFYAAAASMTTDTPSPAAAPKRMPSRNQNESFAEHPETVETTDEVDVGNGVERLSSGRLLIDLNDALAVDEGTVTRTVKNTETGDASPPIPVIIANGSTDAFHAALETTFTEDNTNEPVIKISSSNDENISVPPSSSIRFVIPNAGHVSSATNPTFIENATDSPDGDVAVVADDEGTPADLNQIYFRSFVFAPEVPIRLDYHGRFRDLVGGGVVGLLTGLAQFNFSQLTLKRITHRQGVLGVNRLANVVAREWIEDIRVNQLSSILQGIGPTHSFVQVLQGVRDLFWMPVEQYRRDGRIITGVQRGANAFTTSTLLAVLELTRGAVGIVQRAAECCFDIMCVGGPNQQPNHNAIAAAAHAPQSGMVLIRSNQDQFMNVRLPNQSDHHQDAALMMPRLPPSDFREGVVTAYDLLRTGMTGYVSDVASQIATEHRDKGLVGAAGVTFRHAQPAVVRTVALVSQAANNMLGGLRNQLQPEARRDDIEKWKFPKEQQQQAIESARSKPTKKRGGGARRQLTAADLLYSDDEDENDGRPET